MEKVKEMHPLPGNKVYRDQLVTLGDLQEFKDDLLLSINCQIEAALLVLRLIYFYIDEIEVSCNYSYFIL
jgi:hypothetical protein